MLEVSSGTRLLRSVFHTLAYADIFEYPLTASEVCRYLTSLEASSDAVAQALADRALFAQVGDYFTLCGREHIVEIRKRRAVIAARLWRKAAHYGRLLARLPFVRMVAVTGSLAVSNCDDGNDIDYLIVTAPGRLWTCRALALLIARIAGSHGVRLCPNYLISMNALELQERSLYAAHELVQMVPLSGVEIYEEIRRRNRWTDRYLPNASGAPAQLEHVAITHTGSAIQKGLELLFRLPSGDWLERWEMNRKMERLAGEQVSSLESYFSADVCKGHIDRHGESVAAAFALRTQKTI